MVVKTKTYNNTMLHRISFNVQLRKQRLAALEKIYRYLVYKEHFTPEEYKEKKLYSTKMIPCLKNTAVQSTFCTDTQLSASSMAVSDFYLL